MQSPVPSPLPRSSAQPLAGLAREAELAANLVACLEREQQCLLESDVDGIAAASVEKTRLVSELTHQAKTRHEQVAAQGHAASEAGMQAWLATQSLSSEQQADWNAFKADAEQARELNRRNGVLIQLHLNRTQNALALLRQQNGAEQVYGPDGQQNLKAGGRRLVVG